MCPPSPLLDPEMLRSQEVSGLEEGVGVGGIQLSPGEAWTLVALWLPPVARFWRQAHLAALPGSLVAPGSQGGESEMRTEGILSLSDGVSFSSLSGSEEESPRGSQTSR